MSSLIEMYQKIYTRLSDIHARYLEAEKHLLDFKEEDKVARQARIDNFDKQLKDIAKYYETVEFFRRSAEKNITSKNILSLKALELDFNSLRSDYSKIDPMNPDDPYAFRLYVHTRCNEIYLEEKQKEFMAKRAALLNGENVILEQMKMQVEKVKRQLEEECELYVRSKEFQEFATRLTRTHYKFSDELYSDSGLQASREYENPDKTISLGAYAQPLVLVGENAKKSAKLQIGKYFDEKSFSILLPLEYNSQEEIIINITTSISKENRCFKGISNLLLNLIKRTKPGNRKFKISFIDAIHFNNSQLKALRPLEDSAVIDKIPLNDEEVDNILRNIVSKFPDIDETLQDYDSVEDYNKNVDDEKNIVERQMLVLVGYPDSFSSDSRKYINRIIQNHQRYGISLVLVNNMGYDSYNGEEKTKKAKKLSNNYYNIIMPQSASSTVDYGEDIRVGFRWYEYDYKTHEIPDSYIEGIRLDDKIDNEINNDYTKLFPLDTSYYKERTDETRKQINLPYGVDANGEISSISFEAESFAAYLMGASGSGKSTLLHTLITDIIRNYHPDDVELWLADFKMAEFSQYIDPMPPHIKYILLDESRELVFDLIDKLTEEMLKRQKFFMRHNNLKKVEEVPADIYMPVIFVILDEFSIMSQVLEGDDLYRLKLQNLLAKGRAIGIKFIFASQSYTTGIRGLTQTAKEQIQTRIAMHNNIDEIKETLQLPRFLKTEKNIFMIETLPVYMALRKFYKRENELDLERVKVLYFPGKGEEKYEPQRNLIRRLGLKPVELTDQYVGTANTYINKHPVVVDGNSFDVFNYNEIQQVLAEKIENSDDVGIVLGTPRRLSKNELVLISKESRENLLLVSRNSEQACAMSIIMSAINCFQNQGMSVHIWTYAKNRLYKAYKDEVFSQLVVTDVTEKIAEEVCSIAKKIESKCEGNDAYILLGFEQICGDFEIGDFESSGYKEALESLSSEDNRLIDAEYQDLDEILVKIQEEGIEAGLSKEEIEEKMEKASNDYLKMKIAHETGENVDEEKWNQVVRSNQEVKEKKLDPMSSLKTCVTKGSRWGYHFFACLNQVEDLKSMNLGLNLFRHKLSFGTGSDDSRALFGNTIAKGLPEHVCVYSNSIDSYSFRPFLYEKINWDGWIVENGIALNSYN